MGTLYRTFIRINLPSRHKRGLLQIQPLFFYITIPANTPLWHAVLFYHYYMYRRLTYPEFFRSLAHSRIVVNNIIGNIDCSFFNIFFHGKSPAKPVFTWYAGDLFIMQSPSVTDTFAAGPESKDAKDKKSNKYIAVPCYARPVSHGTARQGSRQAGRTPGAQC